MTFPYHSHLNPQAPVIGLAQASANLQTLGHTGHAPGPGQQPWYAAPPQPRYSQPQQHPGRPGYPAPQGHHMNQFPPQGGHTGYYNSPPQGHHLNQFPPQGGHTGYYNSPPQGYPLPTQAHQNTGGYMPPHHTPQNTGYFGGPPIAQYHNAPQQAFNQAPPTSTALPAIYDNGRRVSGGPNAPERLDQAQVFSHTAQPVVAPITDPSMMEKVNFLKKLGVSGAPPSELEFVPKEAIVDLIKNAEWVVPALPKPGEIPASLSERLFGEYEMRLIIKALATRYIPQERLHEAVWAQEYQSDLKEVVQYYQQAIDENKPYAKGLRDSLAQFIIGSVIQAPLYGDWTAIKAYGEGKSVEATLVKSPEPVIRAAEPSITPAATAHTQVASSTWGESLTYEPLTPPVLPSKVDPGSLKVEYYDDQEEEEEVGPEDELTPEQQILVAIKSLLSMLPAASTMRSHNVAAPKERIDPVKVYVEPDEPEEISLTEAFDITTLNKGLTTNETNTVVRPSEAAGLPIGSMVKVGHRMIVNQSDYEGWKEIIDIKIEKGRPAVSFEIFQEEIYENASWGLKSFIDEILTTYVNRVARQQRLPYQLYSVMSQLPHIDEDNTPGIKKSIEIAYHLLVTTAKVDDVGTNRFAISAMRSYLNLTTTVKVGDLLGRDPMTICDKVYVTLPSKVLAAIARQPSVNGNRAMLHSPDGCFILTQENTKYLLVPAFF